MTSLGRMMAGSARVETTAALALGDAPESYRERSSDFYPTPACAIDAFLAAELVHLEGGRVWEPACGDGAIARKMAAAGLDVLGTDLVDRGYGEGERDFLAERELHGCSRIVTNPPFNLAEAFIRHALLRLDVPYLALLLKATYWHAATRAPLFTLRPPAMIYALTWRPDFLKKGAPTMDVIWCVWDSARSWDGTRYELLMREPAGAAADLFGAVE